MNAFSYFHPVALGLVISVALVSTIVLAWIISRLTTHRRPVCIMVATVCMPVALVIHVFDVSNAVDENKAALAWLKGDGVQTRIMVDNLGVIELVVVEANTITIGDRTLADPSPPTQTVCLSRDEIPAFNAYLKANFPALADSGRRLIGAVASNP